jgi:hypothetical protein
MKGRTITLVLAMLFASGAVWAQQQNPHFGTWKANLGKSTYSPGPPPTATTVKVESWGNDGIKNTTDGVDAQGNKTHGEYSAKYDGKDYSVTGSPNWDKAALKKIDANTTLLINKKDGNVVRLMRQTISKDGKTRTSASVGVNAKGEAFHNIVVFDKQ